MEIWSAPYAVFGPEGVVPEGALLTDGRRVLALGGREELLKRHPSARERRFSTYLGLEAANAHTHLDLGLGPVFKGPFMEFVLKAVFPRNEERGLRLAKEAARSARQHVLGDIVAKDDGTLEWWLLEAPFEGVAYLEVLGLFPPEIENEYLKKLRTTVRRLKKLERPGGPRLGLSPHAPYSLTPSLLKAAVEKRAFRSRSTPPRARPRPPTSKTGPERSPSSIGKRGSPWTSTRWAFPPPNTSPSSGC